MARIEKAKAHSGKDLLLPAIRNGLGQIHRRLNVCWAIERFNDRLPRFAFVIEIVGVFFLNLGRVGQHDGDQIPRCRRAIDRPLESLPHQVGQVAAVIDVSVAQHDGLNVLRSKRKLPIPLKRLPAPALVQSAIQEQLLAIHLDQVHGPSHGPGRPPECHFVFGGHFIFL